LEQRIAIKLIEIVGHVCDEGTERIIGVLLGGCRFKTETKRGYALGKAVLDTYTILPYIN
jgi:hypothetical protein